MSFGKPSDSTVWMGYPEAMPSQLYFGSIVPEVQSVFADIPIVSVGIVALSLATFFIALARLNRAILNVLLAGLFIFAAGILDLLNVVLCESTHNRTIRSLAVSTSVSLSLASGFKYWFLYRKSSQPSRYDRLASPKQQRHGGNDDTRLNREIWSKDEKVQIYAAWSRLGLGVGPVLKFLVWSLILM